MFFPAYYDENTVEPLARASVDAARELTDDFEIIVVDDASPDRTGEIADRLAREIPQVRVIHHPTNRGVGQAMISGWRGATKDYVFYTDGDAQYDVSELKLFMPYVKDYDLIVGYRIKRAEGITRIFTSRVFHLLLLLLFGIHYRDTDCSFKLIHRRVLERLKFRTGGGVTDAEVLIQARKLKIPVKQIGVHHYKRKFGRSVCLRPGLVFSMLRDLAVLRIQLWKEGKS